jgi:hypothetical protein
MQKDVDLMKSTMKAISAAALKTTNESFAVF